MSEALSNLLELLDIEPIEVNIFRGVNMEEHRQRVFGGQVAAQALVAAGRTVDRGAVHSLHSYFLRPGDPTTPILYEVDRIRDGRSFLTRRVVAIQHGQPIFNLQCSFHVEEEGVEHQFSMPEAPEPESLATVPERLQAMGEAAADWVQERPQAIDHRFVGALPWLRAETGSRDGEQDGRPTALPTESRPSSARVWLRTEGKMPDAPLTHAAVMAYASDMTLYEAIIEPHGIDYGDSRFMGASLDHCMWFHRPFRVDEWLLFDQESPAAHGARGLARGLLFTRAGELVMSVVQEGLVRTGRARPHREPAGDPGGAPGG